MDESTKRGLLAAYGRLLRPLIRILIRNDVSYSEFAEVAKETFVRVAREKLVEQEPRDSESLLAAITGMPSGEIERIEESLRNSQYVSEDHLDEIVNILTSWYTKSEFTGPYGLPLELPFKDQKQMDFSTLVASCSQDVDPQEILDELIETNAITETKPGWYKALTRYYQPEGNAPSGIEHLSRTIEDIANTIDHNHSEPDPKRRMFERNVYTEEGIREDDLARFAAFAGEKSQRLIEEIDNWITNLDAPDRSDPVRLSTGFGFYHYVHRETDEDV